MSKAKKSNSFDELHDLNKSCNEMIATCAKTAIEVLKPEVFEKVADKETVGALTKTLQADLEKYATETAEIAEIHKDWKGRPKRPNQYAEALVVGNQYFDLIDRIQSTALPLSVELAEIFENTINEQERTSHE